MSATLDPLMDAQRVAEAVRDTMFANDRASKGLGMRIDAIGPGTATLSMTVRGTCSTASTSATAAS